MRFILITIAILFLPAVSFAAELSLATENSEVNVGKQFSVSVSLNASGESINAAEGELAFPADLLAVKEIRDGNSVINFWVRQPALAKPGVVAFSGITPGGYQGQDGQLFTVVFQASAVGAGAIEIHHAAVLRNDGRGTPASLTFLPLQFFIAPAPPGPAPVAAPVADFEPPEPFTPELARDPNIFGGRWFLVFAAQDKGSGVDHYAVCEGSAEACVVAASPYVLRDQALDEPIFVRAVDRSGNERTAYLPAQRLKPPPYENGPILGILIIILGLLMASVWGVRWLWPKFTKSR